MEFELTEARRAVESVARVFAVDPLAPHVAEWDEHEHFRADAMRRAAALGLAGIYIRSDVGGLGLGRLDAAIFIEGLSEGCTSTCRVPLHSQYGVVDDRPLWQR